MSLLLISSWSKKWKMSLLLITSSFNRATRGLHTLNLYVLHMLKIFYFDNKRITLPVSNNYFNINIQNLECILLKTEIQIELFFFSTNYYINYLSIFTQFNDFINYRRIFMFITFFVSLFMLPPLNRYFQKYIFH